MAKRGTQSKKPKRVRWEDVKALALALELPNVVEATSWGQPNLKAHGKLWVFWSPSEDAPVFKVSREERELLVTAEPERFFVTAHYQSHPLVLMRTERFDAAWARANLVRTWRLMAPRRVLKAYDEAEAARGNR